MERHSITINIFGREFPAMVDAEEADVISHAAKLINEKIDTFRTEYAKQDDLDIVIMCCLDIMTERLKKERLDGKKEDEAIASLDTLEMQLDAALNALG